MIVIEFLSSWSNELIKIGLVTSIFCYLNYCSSFLVIITNFSNITIADFRILLVAFIGYKESILLIFIWKILKLEAKLMKTFV